MNPKEPPRKSVPTIEGYINLVGSVIPKCQSPCQHPEHPGNSDSDEESSEDDQNEIHSDSNKDPLSENMDI